MFCDFVSVGEIAAAHPCLSPEASLIDAKKKRRTMRVGWKGMCGLDPALSRAS